MKALLFFVCVGGGYGLDSMFLKGGTARGLVAWPIGIVLFAVAWRLYLIARYWRQVRSLDPETLAMIDQVMGSEQQRRT